MFSAKVPSHYTPFPSPHNFSYHLIHIRDIMHTIFGCIDKRIHLITHRLKGMCKPEEKTNGRSTLGRPTFHGPSPTCHVPGTRSREWRQHERRRDGGRAQRGGPQRRVQRVGAAGSVRGVGGGCAVRRDWRRRLQTITARSAHTTIQQARDELGAGAGNCSPVVLHHVVETA